MKKVPDNVIVQAIRAMNGEISCNMRLIAFQYDGKHATFRFYMQNKANEDDREMGEVIAVNFEAGHATKLKSLDLEFVHSAEPIGKLDGLDFVLFCRNEQ